MAAQNKSDWKGEEDPNVTSDVDGRHGSEEQTPVQGQDFGDFWPEPEWIRILVFSSSRIIFKSLFRTFAILLLCGSQDESKEVLEFHYIDMCGSRERLKLNPETGFFRIACCEASEQKRIRIQQFQNRIGFGSESSGIRSSLKHGRYQITTNGSSAKTVAAKGHNSRSVFALGNATQSASAVQQNSLERHVLGWKSDVIR